MGWWALRKSSPQRRRELRISHHDDASRTGLLNAQGNRVNGGYAHACCHCEQRSDTAISITAGHRDGDCFATLAMTGNSVRHAFTRLPY
jgi:hypothetical protein